MDVSLVLPAYNESLLLPRIIPNIARELRAVASTFEIIVVDNGSTDNTAQVLQTMQSEVKELVSTRVFPNQGYGNGILAGLTISKGDVIGWTDADDQIDAAEIARLYREMKNRGVPFVKGYRNFEKKPSFLWLRSKVYAAFFMLLFGTVTRDAQGSPRFIARSLYERMHLSSRDWFIASESIIKAGRLGVKPIEIPIAWKVRSSGISKIKPSTTLEFIKNALRYRFSKTL